MTAAVAVAAEAVAKRSSTRRALLVANRSSSPNSASNEAHALTHSRRFAVCTTSGLEAASWTKATAASAAAGAAAGAATTALPAAEDPPPTWKQLPPLLLLSPPPLLPLLLLPEDDDEEEEEEEEATSITFASQRPHSAA
jgi:hypothetical protein